jgi:phospholipase C
VALLAGAPTRGLDQSVAKDRRSFLQSLGGTTLAAAFPASIAKALSIRVPNQSCSIANVEHIVILMQENRSFDHYFGTLNGVRGFADPRAVTLPSVHPVFYQPNGKGGYILPFHPAARPLGLQFLEDLPTTGGRRRAPGTMGNTISGCRAKAP